ncbi:MAG: rod shape-determining protein RodA, partial [Rikenellaceae bacterium]
LVYGSFLIMLYREGFTPWIYIILFMVIALFVLSFIIETWALILLIFICIIILESIKNGMILLKAQYLGLTMFVWLLIELLQSTGIFTFNINTTFTLLISILITLPAVIIYMIKLHLPNVTAYLTLLIGSVLLISSVDFVFNNMMQVHQQKRILDLLGLESDTKGWGYNVNQSKIAIGSGGFLGKGYLNGTQTKYNFVPEQSTDFIFCTIGEEWGFAGSALIVILFTVLIIRLMRMGDNQKEPFGRIYCYYVASILMFHMAINIGMTIGLIPVIGIPLAFFSYGGSSLMAFTILLFIAIRLDSRRNEISRF